jgi:hypothetical protein
VASISILSGMDKSHWGGLAGALARNRVRKTTLLATGPMGVEGKGRVFTRKRGEVRPKTRRHDKFAKAVDLDLPLLHRLQHENSTRGATAALFKALPRFLVTGGQMRTAIHGRALVRLSFTRVSARFAVRSPGFLEGAILDRRAGARTRHNRNLTVSAPYIRV